MASKTATAENKLFEAERKVEALATLQSHRWMEFSKMADNMKELSHSMLTQSKSNTRKAAIRSVHVLLSRFYPDFTFILSRFYPYFILIYPDKIWINNFIQILS